MKAEIISSMQKLLEADNALTVQKQFKELSAQFRTILEEEKAVTPQEEHSDDKKKENDIPTESSTDDIGKPATSRVHSDISESAENAHVGRSEKIEESNGPSVEIREETPSEEYSQDHSSSKTTNETDSGTEDAMVAESTRKESAGVEDQIGIIADAPKSENKSEKEEKGRIETPSETAPLDDPEATGKAALSSDEIDDKKKQDIDLKTQFDALNSEFRKKLATARESKLKLESETIAKAKQLLEELQELVEKEENIGKAFSGFNAIQEHWKHLPKVSNDAYRDLNAEYNKVIERFFYNINIYKELKELDLKHNLEQKTLVLEDQKKLLDVEDVRLLEVEVRLNQDRWNAIGPTFKEEWDKIKDEFWAVTRTIYRKVQDVYNKKREEQEENYKAKEDLLEAVTGILAVESHTPKKWQEQTKEIIAIQEKWKTIGFVPKEKSGPLWKKFRKSCDHFFDNKRKFFGEIHKAHSANKEAKEKLVLEAERLKDSVDWAKTTSELIQLQKTWKTVGPAHQSDDQALWHRFRAACDHFFQAKNAEQAGEGQRQQENLVQKQKLIEELEAFVPGTEKDKNLEDLKSFSEKWRSIGHVPFKDKDEVNKFYKAAMDEKFKALKIDQRSRQMMRFEEKVETFSESSGGDRLIKKERDFIRGKISRLESDIKLFENNMGFFANSKGAEKLKEEVVRKIDRAKEELEGLYEQLQILHEVQ